MKKPIPNILYNEINEAKKRLHEYSVKCIYKETNLALPNSVLAYKANEKKNLVTLTIAKAPKNSFSLDPKVEYVNIVNRVTGRKSPNKKVLVPAKAGATDLGIPLKLDERTIFLYGDTFSGNDVNQGCWNSNFIAISKKEDYENGLYFSDVVKDSNNIIKPICQGLHHRDLEENVDLALKREVTKIPTGAILIGENVYIFMMHVRHWGKPGEWFVTDNVCYVANKYKLDEFKPTNLVFSCTESDRFGQIFPFENEFDKEHIYFVAIPGGRFGNLSLLRVKKEKFLEKDSYELCVGKDKFVSLKDGLKKEPYFILENLVSEPSIMYNHYLKKWLISCIKPEGIFFYTSDSLYEKFSDRIKILTGKEVKSYYGGFISPCMCKLDDKKMFIQVSQWSPIYNTSLVEILFK